MILSNERRLHFKDVAILPKRSSINSRNDVSLIREFTTPFSKQQLNIIPVIVSNLDTTGVFKMAIEVAKHNMLVALHKFYSEDALIDFSKSYPDIVYNNVFYTLGMREGDIEKFRKVQNVSPYRLVMIDVPNGYIKKFYEYTKRFREEFPYVILGAGNVVTAEAVQELILNCGVEFIKCGIASGGLCNSYGKTGVFSPQLSTCIECADAAHSLGAFVISDGGIKEVGDFSKAFCANADAVMAGSFFCGVDECDGEFINSPISKLKVFKAYGMSSDVAINKYYNGEGLNNHRTSEGLVKEFPLKGPVSNLCWDIIGGLKSTGSYIGAKSIKHFGKCTTFIYV